VGKQSIGFWMRKGAINYITILVFTILNVISDSNVEDDHINEISIDSESLIIMKRDKETQ